MKVIAVLISLLMMIGVAEAVPTVSSASINGTSGSVTGSGFGTKSTAAPIKWDNFESGTNGNDLSGYTLGSGTSSGTPILPKYSNVREKNGSLSARFSFLGQQYNCIARIDFSSVTQIYFRYYLYIEHLTGQVSRNIKPARAIYPSENATHGTPSMAFILQPPYDLGIFGLYTSSSTVPEDDDSFSPQTPSGQWVLIEEYGKMGTINIANGVKWMKQNGTYKVNKQNAITYTSNTSNNGFTRFILPFYVAHTGVPTQGGDYYMYADDLYVDSTLQRVEIGDSENYSACTIREVQIPTAWSATSISFTVNQGSLPSNNNFLFVLDSNGDPNATGKPINFGVGDPDAQAPSLFSITPDRGATGLAVD